jgi:multidrug resistance efflux pump
MAEQPKNIELRSDEVQEIMGTPPKWIVRWGVTIISLVVVVLLVGSYFYKYPDIISSRVTIVSENPPVSIVARTEGKLEHLFVEDAEVVDANTLLAILENTAEYRDVYRLRNNLDSVKHIFDNPILFNNLSFKNNYSLGQYHSHFSAFIAQLQSYKTYLSFNTSVQRIQSLESQIADYSRLVDKQREEISVLRQDYELAVSQFLRDSALFARQVMSEVNFEKSQTAVFRQKSAYQNAMTQLTSTQITINQLKQQIKELQVSNSETGSNALASLKEKYENLVNQLKTWEQTYVLKSPIAGKVTFTNFWSANQFVSPGQIVFTVVPKNELEIIGRAFVPVVGAGKVEIGHRVNLKLDNYPYMEYGIVEGRVESISMVPVTNAQGSFYSVEIELVDNLNTNYKKTLLFNQEMQGTAEIITKDLRLIQRLFNPFKNLWNERVKR